MEERLNTILNIFERSLIENQRGERSDYGLKNDYIDMKYDFLKLLLDATHKQPTEFNFDLFQEKVKRTSPLRQTDYTENEFKVNTYTKKEYKYD